MKSPGSKPVESAPGPRWQRVLPWALLVVAALYAISALVPPKSRGPFDDVSFGRLPIQLGGRIKPMDTVARTSLLQISGQLKVPLEGNGPKGQWGTFAELEATGDGKGLTFRKWHQFGRRPHSLRPTEWLMEVLMVPDRADTRHIFRVHHPELLRELGLDELGVDQSGLRFYTFRQLRPYLLELHREGERINKISEEQRNPYERSKYKLAQVLELYVQLRYSLQPNRLDLDHGPAAKQPVGVEDFAAELSRVAADGRVGSRELEKFLEETGQDKAFFGSLFQHIGERILREGPLSADDGALAARLAEAIADVRQSNQARLEEMSAPEREQYRMVDAAFAAFLPLEPARQARLARHLWSVQSRYQTMESRANLRLIPPGDPVQPDWAKVGATVLEAAESGEVPPALRELGAMSSAYVSNKPKEFAAALGRYHLWLGENKYEAHLNKARREQAFNHASPFVKSMRLYLVALLFAAFSWLNMSGWLRRTAFYLVGLAFCIHTAGIVTRMLLEGRPPVTNLYSSAVFVGWGAALLGWVLERVFRNGIGSCTAGAIGFATLIIADHLALAGDTMEMMRAVLDTNFWLATHVTCITLGYAATFLAGFLALVYVLRGTLTRTLEASAAQALTRMTYGIICFATLFSFVGTVLGGIWADQSWGRFWGWDAKENGALLIVIWNVLILHCRWGGIVRDRGLMNLAVFGNVVTAWSWFGVNMLGIGLHSYGFMDEAFQTLQWFGISQLVVIGVGCLPLQYWASGRALLGVVKPPA